MHPVLDLLEQRVAVEDAAVIRHAELESAGLRLATHNEASAKAARKSVTVERSGERMSSTVAHKFEAVVQRFEPTSSDSERALGRFR